MKAIIPLNVQNTLRTRGFFGLYSGASALIIGNGAKSAVRFMAWFTDIEDITQPLCRQILYV